MSKETTIVKLAIEVRADTLCFKADAFKATETNKAYKWTGNLIKKTLLKKIDTIFNEVTTFVQYYTWCLPQDIKEMEAALLQHATEVINTRLENTLKLKEALILNPTRKQNLNY